MKKTGIVVICQHCNKEFEVFSDDGGRDETVVWNWCPHCGERNDLWMRFKKENEDVPLGVGFEEAMKIKARNKDKEETWNLNSEVIEEPEQPKEEPNIRDETVRKTWFNFFHLRKKHYVVEKKRRW